MKSEPTKIKLSVVVPCYKAEEYLPKCLASLVGQTLQDIEIVCVNDGSPDRCIDILHEWQNRYPQKIVVIDKPNEGVWRARMDGIRAAHGEYIGFLDSDDYAEPDFAERLYEAASSNNADIVACGFSRIDLNTHKTLSRELCVPRESFSIAQEPGRIVEINGAVWNKAFRASVLKSMHDLTEPPPVVEDLLLQLLAYLQSQGTVIFVPESLVNYMVRDDSSMNSVSQEQVGRVYQSFLEVKDIYARNGASEGLMMALDATAFLHVGISLNLRLSENRGLDLNAAFAQSKEYLDTNFPTWRNSPYINGRYARLHGTSYKRLLTSSRMFKLGLLAPFFSVYQFVTKTFMIDIKW